MLQAKATRIHHHGQPPVRRRGEHEHGAFLPASIDEGCTNDGVRLRLSDDDQPAGAGAGSAGFRLQGRGAGQRLFQRDDDPGPVHGLHLQQGVGAGDLLLLGAGWSRADRPPLPLHGPGRHRHVLRHRHQPDQGTGAPRRLQGQGAAAQPVHRRPCGTCTDASRRTSSGSGGRSRHSCRCPFSKWSLKLHKLKECSELTASHLRIAVCLLISGDTTSLAMSPCRN
uniref:Uncharacterized protein n=1 Tax=Zea mays TaxID=4577 RepID=A0A804Q700_MAIZE